MYCKLCGKECSLKGNANTHDTTHHLCNMCAFKEPLEENLEIQGKSVKTFSCEQCNYKGYKTDHLKQHKETVHVRNSTKINKKQTKKWHEFIIMHSNIRGFTSKKTS